MDDIDKGIGVDPACDERAPARVRKLWKEVGDQLVSQSTSGVAKYAVEALQGAQKYLNSMPPSPQARIFIERNMVPMMKILLDQLQSKLGPTGRKVVEVSCRVVLQIVRDDLGRADIIKQNQGVTFPFKSSITVLGLLFIRDNNYFTSLHSTWSIDDGRRSRQNMIMMFRRIGGLSPLSSYMNDRIGTASFPGLRVLQSIVSAAWEVLLTVESPFLEAKQQQIAVQSTQKKNVLKKILSLLKANEQQIEEQSTQQMTILNQIEEVQGIAFAATQHLLAVDEGILVEAPPECVNRIIQTSKAIYNQIETLQDKLVTPTNDHLTCTTEKFFVFWRAFSLKMVRSSSSSLKSFGWGQITKLVDESIRLRPSPQGYLVSGAGSKFINGIYMLDPQKTLDGKASELEYTRIVPDNEKEGAGKKITLFRCTMRSRQKWWFLSEADEHQPGTDMDIDYYQHKSQKHEEESPSLSGWLIIGRGKYPPPTLEPLVGPSSDERSSIKNQLVEWVEENVLNEAARDICLSSKVARSVMSLYKFMTTYQELHRKSVNLTGDHIQQILSVCQKTTNLVALTELYLQFIIIRPSLPSNLHTIFDQAICRIKLILERQTHLEDVSFESDEDVASVLRLLIDCHKSDSFIWPDSSKHLEILKTFSLRLVKSNLQIAREAGWDGVNILLVELSTSTPSMTKELADWIESNQLLSLALGSSTHHKAIAMARSIVTMEEEFLQESHLQIALDTFRNTDSADVVAEMHRFISSVIDLLPDRRIIVDPIMKTAVIRRIELDDQSLSWLCIGNEGTGLWRGETLLNLDHLEADGIFRIGNAIEQNSCLTGIRFTDDASFEDLDDESRREGFLGLVHALENSKTISEFCLSSCTFEGGAGNELLLAAGEMRLRKLLLHGCDLNGWSVHSLIRTLRKLQRRLQFFGLESCHLDESVLKLILPSLKNLCELQRVSLQNSNLQNEGCLLLADLLACPQCNIHILDIENTGVDSEGLQAIANVLATNSKLLRLNLSGNSINEECWQTFSQQLCNTEKNKARLSNHTLRSIQHPGISEELLLFLKFNQDTNKKRVVVKKILYHNGHFSMVHFFSWGLRLMPNAVNWFDKAQTYFKWDDAPLSAFKDEDIGRRKLNAIYQFVKEMPLQFAR
mmetsp:Transcript_32402/g.74017  ORF Transcript_32402/g.74017 Transcript_32402/m.74017 type:complete len:1142 (-) Transcript_32402:94-3519(-)